MELEIFVPDDEYLTEDGLVKKEAWDDFVKVLKQQGLDPKDYECIKEE